MTAAISRLELAALRGSLVENQPVFLPLAHVLAASLTDACHKKRWGVAGRGGSALLTGAADTDMRAIRS